MVFVIQISVVVAMRADACQDIRAKRVDQVRILLGKIIFFKENR